MSVVRSQWSIILSSVMIIQLYIIHAVLASCALGQLAEKFKENEVVTDVLSKPPKNELKVLTPVTWKCG